MTKLSDSTVKIKLADKELELFVTLELLRKVSEAYEYVTKGDKEVVLNGILVYYRKLEALHVDTILELLSFGLQGAYSHEELAKMCFNTEGSFEAISKSLVPFIELMYFGGKKSEASQTEKKPKAKV